MTNLGSLKIGDPVMINDINRGWSRRTVSKVGHKYVHAGDQKFDIATGRVADQYGHAHAYTLSQWEHIEAVEKARKALRGLGLTVERGTSEEAVLRMVDLLKPMLDAKVG
jgi:hypothetical protein